MALFERYGGAIDVHAHYLPPAYTAALERYGISRVDGNVVPLPRWSVAEHLALADALGIATSMLAISSPGLLLAGSSPAEVIALAAAVNDDGAAVAREHPERFALLASLPLPDLDAALAELDRAFDTLGAVGISLLSNYAGVYAGDPRLEPLFAELSNRRALVVLHPTSPPGWEAVSFGRTRGMLEFMFDSARAVYNLVLSGTLERHRDLTLVIPHAGGVIPLLAQRADQSRLFGETSQVDVFATLRRALYDLAGTPLPRQLPALLSLVGADRLVYGSDYPFSPSTLVESGAREIIASSGLDEAQLTAAFRTTIAPLLPGSAG